MSAQLQCRHFSGYKPCPRHTHCDEQCPQKEIVTSAILIVHLGALGAVVRSTGLLKALRRKHPHSMITWVTDAPAHKLLEKHPGIDRVLTTQEVDLLQLSALRFDAAYVIDKSLKAVGVLRRTDVRQVFGFTADPVTGAILPATPAAEELWQLGLDNYQKFFVNKKSELQLVHEALELGPYRRDPYWLPLTEIESQVSFQRRLGWLGTSTDHPKSFVIGLNTGCSDVIKAKKLSVEGHRELIELLKQKFPGAALVLLGGPEDTQRNDYIAEGSSDVILSETRAGLRDGLISVAACDIVVTGDSLGMHMAISQQKQIVAWFGPTCAQEIDLFQRGVVVKTTAPCAPCWKRSCEKNVMCYDLVSLKEIVDGIQSCRADRIFRGPSSVDPAPEENAPAMA